MVNFRHVIRAYVSLVTVLFDGNRDGMRTSIFKICCGCWILVSCWTEVLALMLTAYVYILLLMLISYIYSSITKQAAEPKFQPRGVVMLLTFKRFGEAQLQTVLGAGMWRFSY